MAPEDLESLKRLLLELEASEKHYRQIVELTGDGVVKVDADAVITFSNPSFREMLGFDESALVGQSIFSFMDEPSEALARETRKLRIQGVRSSIEVVFRAKGGRDVHASMSGAPILDGDGRYTGSFALVRNITEQKNMAARMMISERLASVGTLAEGVAHEINNPLSVVISNLSYLSGVLGVEPVTSDARDAMREAIDAAHRVRVIIRDLMHFSGVIGDDALAPVDVRRTLEATLRMVASKIRPRARLVESYGDVPPVLANEARLGQVFLNLLVNASQAIPEGQPQDNEIHVTLRRQDARVIVEVRDTGEGMPEAMLARIFDAFYTTRPAGGGTGLGLAVSHSIVRSFGGDLTVRSTVGKGATFTVSIPVPTAG